MYSPVISTTIVGVLVAAFVPCFGQTPKQKVKVYNAIISTVYEGPAYRGVPLAVTDSGLVMLSKGKEVRIPYNSIKHIRFKRTASVGRGAIIGASTGLVLGLIIGFASGDDECPPGQWCIYQATAGEKALAGGLVLSGVGATLGVVIGGVSQGHKIVINGDQRAFQSKQAEMEGYIRKFP